MNNPIKELVNRIVFRGLESFGRHYSCYRGFVLNNVDPLLQERLFVHVPHISGRKEVGNWAWPKGKPHNITCTPKLGDMVWVEFESGDYRYPVWSYSNQNRGIGKKTNPHHNPGDLKWKTEHGHQVFIDDYQGIIHLRHSKGNKVEVTEDSITLSNKEGLNLIVKDDKIKISNDSVNLKDSLDSLMTLIETMIITTPAGPGNLSPADITKLADIKNKFNQLLY